MPLDLELKKMMLEEVVVTPVTGKDRFNNFTYGAPVTSQCKIMRQNVRTLDVHGREVISTAQIIFADPTLSIDTDAKIVLPDGSKPAIIEVLSTDDEVGPYYLEARL